MVTPSRGVRHRAAFPVRSLPGSPSCAWWAPKSIGIDFVSCEADARTGASYRLVFTPPAAGEPMALFGRYPEVVPPPRLVWTNGEGGEGGSVTTVTFEPRGAGTLVTVPDLHASKEAPDEAIASGSTAGVDEQFEQLDDLLVTLDRGA
jgi:uncharacterized protein YndB with AHSA1/START domain